MSFLSCSAFHLKTFSIEQTCPFFFHYFRYLRQDVVAHRLFSICFCEPQGDSSFTPLSVLWSFTLAPKWGEPAFQFCNGWVQKRLRFSCAATLDLFKGIEQTVSSVYHPAVLEVLVGRWDDNSAEQDTVALLNFVAAI